MKLKKIILVLALMSVSLVIAFPRNTTKQIKYASSTSEYTKVLRYQDDFIYEDAVKDISKTDNILSDSTLMDNFMVDDDEYKYEGSELSAIKKYILNIARQYDSNASFTIPNNFDYDDKYMCSTTFDDFERFTSTTADFSNTYSILRSKYEEKIEQGNKDDSSKSETIKKKENVEIINVLVHGIGGGNHHWSNNGTREFALRENTIPYMLKQHYNSDVYLFSDSKITKYLANEDLKDKFTSEIPCDFTNGAVIVYEDNKNTENFTNEYYDIFKKNINEILNVYPNAKLNLFGHSRGGNINLLFATEYPLKVNNIYSIATPYYSPVLSNIDEFVQNAADSSKIMSEVKNFVDSIGLNHIDAYASLSNEEYMKNMRQNWNALDTKPNLYTLGYNFGFGYSCFIKILWFTIRIDIGLIIPWDVLVGSNNACGLPASTFNLNYLNNNYLIAATSDNSEPLEAKERKLINIPASYILDILVNNKNYLKSAPDNYCVPHNLETMYSKTISTIKGWL